MENTQDLSRFGYREKDMAGDLLKAYKSDHDKTQFLGDGVVVEFNPSSANVFLVDEDFNAAMMNDDNLEDWLWCPECGNEGFQEDLEEYAQDCCKAYLKEIV